MPPRGGLGGVPDRASDGAWHRVPSELAEITPSNTPSMGYGGGLVGHPSPSNNSQSSGHFSLQISINALRNGESGRPINLFAAPRTDGPPLGASNHNAFNKQIKSFSVSTAMNPASISSANAACVRSWVQFKVNASCSKGSQ